jgi:hypothetical protein
VLLPDIKDLLKWSSAPLLWLSSRPNRKRLGGARVEIIGMVMCAQPAPQILMVKSVYDNCWMPPQEGVNLREPLVDALARGLSEECNFSINESDGTLKSDYYLRDVEYVDTLWLPPERWGERAVAGNVVDTPFSHIVLRKKAYWVAYLIVGDVRVVRTRPNLREVVDVVWMSADEAATAMQANRDDKAALLARCLQKGMQHLLGAEPAWDWAPGSER